jgi:hypothetical protein
MAKHEVSEPRRTRMPVENAEAYFEMFNYYTKIVRDNYGKPEYLNVMKYREKTPIKTFPIRRGMVTIEDIESNISVMDIK